MNKNLVSVFVLLFLLPVCVNALIPIEPGDIRVDFSDLDEGSYPVINSQGRGVLYTDIYRQDGVTVEGGPNRLVFFKGGGVSVEGGGPNNNDDFLLNPGEWITVSFDSGAALDVALLDFYLATMVIEAFDKNGQSLGVVEGFYVVKNISNLFGNVPISSFRYSYGEENWGSWPVWVQYKNATPVPIPPLFVFLFACTLVCLNIFRFRINIPQ